jgi:hypothetical protein
MEVTTRFLPVVHSLAILAHARQILAIDFRFQTGMNRDVNPSFHMASTYIMLAFHAGLST